jgi:lysophospholipase L1-like esterase
VRVQLYGDSTQVAAYRWGYLQSELDARFGTGRVELVLQAVSGTNSQQLVAGTDGLNAPWPDDLDADIAMVNHGINDEGYHRDDMATYAANMRLFAVGDGKARMVIETPNPIAHWMNIPDAPWADAGRQAAAEAGIPVADVQAYVLGLQGWEGMLTDGIHPSHELQAAIAKNVTAPTLAPIIAPMLCR